MHLTKALQLFDTAIFGEVAPRTRQWYANRLRSLVDFFGDCELEAIEPTGLREWRAELLERDSRWADHPTRPTMKSGLSPYTVAGYVRACRRFFNWLVEEGWIERSPAHKLKLPKLPEQQPKAIAEADLWKMLEAARESSARDYAVVRFVASTGCRLGGLAGLRVEDLDLCGLRAVVREKGGQLRFVFFDRETGRALSTYLEERDSDAEELWIGRVGPLTKDGIYRIFRRLAKKAGVKDNWNPHAFRHAWAIMALQNGADLGTVSRVLGHSDIKVTHDHYAIWADGELAARARRFSPLSNEPGDAGL